MEYVHKLYILFSALSLLFFSNTRAIKLLSFFYSSLVEEEYYIDIMDLTMT